MLTITHTHETGTVLEGTARGDGTALILKAVRLNWRWSRNLGAWYVPRSRDKMADHYGIDRTATALREAGHEVTVTIDDTHRDVATAEAERTARQEDRVQALAAKADRAEVDAEAAWQRAERTADRLPPGGEPIKIGHHSEGRHRRDIARAHDAMGRSVTASAEADEAARRAEASTHTTTARYSRTTVHNRIKTLTADRARVERRITGNDPRRYNPKPATGTNLARLQARAAYLDAQIDYWTTYAAEHHPVPYGRHNVKAGDLVKVCDEWCRVVRANLKTVTVETDYSWTKTAPWHTVSDHKPGLAPATPKRAQSIPVWDRRYDIRVSGGLRRGVVPSAFARTETGWQLTFMVDGTEWTYQVGPRGGAVDAERCSPHRAAA